MLRSIKELEGYTVGATDGDIGQIKDFYFDDSTWAIRYLIVDTGSWLSSHKVLISPTSIDHPNWAVKQLLVGITREQVEGSPSIDTDNPVSQQHQEPYLKVTSMTPSSTAITGYSSVKPQPADGASSEPLFADVEEILHRDDDRHLRSCKAVIGYHVEASDGEIGHVEGMLVDDETWALRYLVVNTSNWWIGHSVLIEPSCIKGMSWTAETISVDLSRDAVKQAPPYDPLK